LILWVFIFYIFSALAEFEWDIIKERTMAGLAAARARGKSGGRPKRSPKSSK
jgi:DNA invertase Pin-like site-specific DNA recombinase